MDGLDVRAFDRPDRDAVVRLWERCDLTRPWNDPDRDIERKLAIDPEGFLVGFDTRSGNLVASVMAGYDGHRGWINYLAVDPEHRASGVGRAIMESAERLLAARGCPKINLQIRTSNLAAVRFYERLGYVPDDVVSMSRRLVHDDR